MGGLFLYGSRLKPVGTSLKLVFEVSEGLIFAGDAMVRNIVRGEGMGVEFTKITSQGRDLLERLLERLLRWMWLNSPVHLANLCWGKVWLFLPVTICGIPAPGTRSKRRCWKSPVIAGAFLARPLVSSAGVSLLQAQNLPRSDRCCSPASFS